MLRKVCLALVMTALPVPIAVAADDFGGGLPFGTRLEEARALLKDIPTESQAVMGFVTIEQAYSADGEAGTLMYFFSPRGLLHKKTFALSPAVRDGEECRAVDGRISRRIADRYNYGRMVEAADQEVFLGEYVYRLDDERRIVVHYTFGKPMEGCNVYVMYDDRRFVRPGD